MSVVAALAAGDDVRVVHGADRVEGGRLVRLGSTAVLVALVYAAIAQGAFYSGQLRVTGLVVGCGLLLGLIGVRPSRRDVDAVLLAAVGLGAWYVVAATVAHEVGGAVPALVVLGAAAAIVLVVRRADLSERRLVLAGVVAIGVVVALTGWVGVAWRHSPWTLEDGGLWRAASTITYANATGGLLGALVVVAIGTFVERGRTAAAIISRLVTYILAVGLFASASRAGVLGCVVGLIVVGLLRRDRASHALPILVGALIALAALAPSMLASQAPRPGLACIGLALGALIAVAPRKASVVAGLIALTLFAVPGTHHSVSNALQSLRHDRDTLSSPDRAHERNAAVQLASEHPITGIGPGRVDLTWNTTSPTPTSVHVAYAHNEYLQVLDESGVIGLGILALGLAAVATRLWRGRRSVDARVFAGCLGALVALAVHSSMDFLWHIPLIPLTGAVLVGMLLAPPEQPSQVASPAKERT